MQGILRLATPQNFKGREYFPETELQQEMNVVHGNSGTLLQPERMCSMLLKPLQLKYPRSALMKAKNGS